MFVAQTYCDITNIRGERIIATKLHLVASNNYNQNLVVVIDYCNQKNTGIQLYYSNHGYKM
jgi:hypothetical protein